MGKTPTKLTLQELFELIYHIWRVIRQSKVITCGMNLYQVFDAISGVIKKPMAYTRCNWLHIFGLSPSNLRLKHGCSGEGLCKRDNRLSQNQKIINIGNLFYLLNTRSLKASQPQTQCKKRNYHLSDLKTT